MSPVLPETGRLELLAVIVGTVTSPVTRAGLLDVTVPVEGPAALLKSGNISKLVVLVILRTVERTTVPQSTQISERSAELVNNLAGLVSVVNVALVVSLSNAEVVAVVVVGSVAVILHGSLTVELLAVSDAGPGPSVSVYLNVVRKVSAVVVGLLATVLASVMVVLLSPTDEVVVIL